MRVALGSDHGGFELKQEIIKYLEEKQIAYKDYGCHSTESTDYPIYAKKVAHGILDGECDLGILVCGTGIGIFHYSQQDQGNSCRCMYRLLYRRGNKTSQ